MLQETPYSAFITIRKRFCKDFNKSLVTKNIVAEDDLNSEIEWLRNTIREKDVEIEESRNESFILQQRLEKAEKDTFKHFEDANQKIARLAEEISVSKLIKKKDNENIAEVNSELSKVRKVTKCLQKSIHNLEKKNDNLTDKIVGMNAEKQKAKKEKDKILSELKSLKKIMNKPNPGKSIADLDVPTELTNNNLAPGSIKSVTSSTSTSTKVQSSTSPVASTQTIPTSSECLSFKCLVCQKIVHTSLELKEHSEEEHQLSIDLQKLEELSEKDLTTRFLRSMNCESEYLNERRQFFPGHDHIEERIKIRLLTQMNLLVKTTKIERNMKNNDLNSIGYSGFSFETSQL